MRHTSHPAARKTQQQNSIFLSRQTGRSESALRPGCSTRTCLDRVFAIGWPYFSPAARTISSCVDRCIIFMKAEHEIGQINSVSGEVLASSQHQCNQWATVQPWDAPGLSSRQLLKTSHRQNTYRPSRARERATMRRRTSLKCPTVFVRTRESRTISFCWPWNRSTVVTLAGIPKMGVHAHRFRRTSRMRCFCPL